MAVVGILIGVVLLILAVPVVGTSLIGVEAATTAPIATFFALSLVFLAVVALVSLVWGLARS